MGGSIQQFGAISTGSGLPSVTGRFSHIMPGNANGRFVIQSGYALATNPAQNGNFVSFPVAFPTACVAIVMSEAGAAGWDQSYTCYAPNSFYSAGFTFSAVYGTQTGAFYAANAGASYIAIGY
jgi:hypothetical protein